MLSAYLPYILAVRYCALSCTNHPQTAQLTQLVPHTSRLITLLQPIQLGFDPFPSYPPVTIKRAVHTHRPLTVIISSTGLRRGALCGPILETLRSAFLAHVG